ncbi:MAG: sugar ABC transporter substrate-binding protein [Blastopirellula sp.]|nr:MAG: sugar ABC transporter substrate-binding protein [Blastopirellula sp.]
MKLKKIIRSAAIAVVFAATATVAMAADIAIIGGKADDAFWNKIKKGIDDARLVVEANGGSVDYLRLQSYDNFAADAAEIIRVAIAKKPDGIAVPNWVPESQDGPIKEAIAAGIKVILFNGGSGKKAKELGAINYVGAAEYPAGRAAGQYMVDAGVEKGLCINTLPGTTVAEERCKGFIDAMTEAGKSAEQLPLPTTTHGDPAAVAEAVKAYLTQNPDIGGGITMGASEADAAAVGIAQAGKTGSFVLGSFDFNEATLSRIQHGEQAFAIDQQPYLQPLLAIQILASAIDFGTNLPTAPILTGPGIIDASNVEATLAGVKLGAR